MTDHPDPVETLARFGAPPKPHRSGEVVLDVVYADPGMNSFYYREKKPDSVAAFIRADLVAALVNEETIFLIEGIREAIRLAEQPHYGDTDTALDHYGEAVEVLRSLLKKQGIRPKIKLEEA